MEDEIVIPFLGDTDVSNDTTSEGIASWVQPQDKIPLLLALSMYGQPRQILNNYNLVIKTPRVASWVDFETNNIIVGLKGTSDTSLSADVVDDIVIMSAPKYCDLSIVGEAIKVVEATMTIISDHTDELVTGRVESNAEPTLVFAGHSLGGTAAMCLTMKYPNSVGVSFNGGAAPTNPILDGPGPERFTHYHIVGDLISSHMSEKAARVRSVATNLKVRSVATERR